MSVKTVLLSGFVIGSVLGFGAYEGLLHVDRQMRSEGFTSAQETSCGLAVQELCLTLDEYVDEPVLTIEQANSSDVQPSDDNDDAQEPIVQETNDAPKTVSTPEAKRTFYRVPSVSVQGSEPKQSNTEVTPAVTPQANSTTSTPNSSSTQLGL